jgi:hypothetical protein
LKIGGKGQDGGYQGGPNGVGPWEYIKEKPKVLHFCCFQNWEIALQLSIGN